MKYRSSLLHLSLLLGLGAILTVFSYSNAAKIGVSQLPETKKIVIFLTNDDLGHSTWTHEFYAGSMLLKSSLANSKVKDSIECKVINNWTGDTSQLAGADLIVHYYRGNQFSLLNKTHHLVQQLTQRGVSQMFIHFGVDPGNLEAENAIRNWTGGVYKENFSTNPMWTIDAQLTPHPINNGVNSYSLMDEWYMNIDFEEAPKFKGVPKVGETYSIMHGTKDALKGNNKIKKAVGENPTDSQLTVFWAKEHKNGARGVAVTGGHYHRNWANEGYRKQVLNAIAWGAGVDVPKTGIVSPKVSHDMLKANIDKRKKGYNKKNNSKYAKMLKPGGDESWTPPPLPKAKVGLHPLFTLQNLDVDGDDTLKIMGMAFHGDALFVTTMSPDRTDKKPFKKGKVLRIDNVKEAGIGGEKILITELCDGLYEPSAIAVVGDSIYVGEKHRIIRFDNGAKLNKLNKSKAVVVIGGTSTDNFHTYTIGFEKIVRDGKIYLNGNFTTAIKRGGARDKMIPQNKDVHRGSNFMFGPVSGKEAVSDIKLSFLAGGFRTPNGVEVGPDNVVYVADNQGVFNPSNELHRIEPGSFYGHFLHTKGGKAAAFQPKDTNPVQGSPVGQQPTTVHLPQGSVAKSPAQPHVIRNRTGVLAPYNGQILLTAFTKGEILRVAMEEVDKVWQGVVFRHSAGVADENGNNGFTAGPNRIEQGPDGHYYIGQIGAGGLWVFNQRWHGLQRFAVKKQAPAEFNEIVNVKVVDSGFKLEFYQPVPEDSISVEDLTISQWTYHPTKKYGGSQIGTFKLKAASLEFNTTRTSAILKINGLKDGSAKFIIKGKNTSSVNSGWVTHVKFDPKVKGKSIFHSKEFWYTLHRKIGGQEAKAHELASLSAREKIELKFQNLCIACHQQTEAGWGAPNLKGLLGRKQTVIRNGKEVVVTVDRNYIINSILKSAAERPKAFKDAVMPDLGLKRKEAEALTDYIIKLKNK